ncbi:MAG: tRNA uridine-5-carboxymethylaminomethyl(34) synthesis GTPase MnmE [Bdellovibrionaceae bacterium]|nr:tRNA uridine-5-carboxymethylaminomethyl(34) synthesis GTPase MnmE [Pseudobdellovibrionaceae bacterium]
MKDDTIVALCTPKGKGALSLLRISGPKASKITRKMASFLPSKLKSHKAYFGTLKTDSHEIDQVLITYFKKGHSFTGEETIEISCHGGKVYLEVLKILLEKGARLAQKGEFSFQAFSNGKMDLVQSEALLQLVEAESHLARKQALFQLKGKLSKKFLEIEKKWIFLLSHVEADIDFSLENLKLLEDKKLKQKLKALRKELESLIYHYRPFEKLQTGLIFGIFGQTNVGKSSLFNALLKENKAIVSKEEGTTRDIIEGKLLNAKGLNILLKDSAGFRESKSEGEVEGQKRSYALFKECDYRLLLVDSSQPQLEKSLFQDLKNTWLIFTKSDLLQKGKQKTKLFNQLKKKYKDIKTPAKIFIVSSLLKEGISDLRKNIRNCGISQSEDFLISNSRHHKALIKMKDSLIACEKLNFERDIMALELRQGLLALYEILGKQIEDKVLDKIFKQFCIGK